VSGVGNCINMLSLPTICHMPAVAAGDDARRLGEFNPWQIRWARERKQPRGIGVSSPARTSRTCRAGGPGGCEPRFNTWRPAAVLIGQRVLGAKISRSLQANDPSERAAASPRRRCRTAGASAASFWYRGLGAPNWESPPPATTPTIFRSGLAMGAASMMGLGLCAGAAKRNVLVITGDGEMLNERWARSPPSPSSGRRT